MVLPQITRTEGDRAASRGRRLRGVGSGKRFSRGDRPIGARCYQGPPASIPVFVENGADDGAEPQSRGGNVPPWIKAWRRATRNGRLISRTVTVARPMGVSPRRTGPSHRKWRLHLWRRGLKSPTIFRDTGSTPAMFGPLWLLHAKQLKARLVAEVGPRCLRATMWSIWCGRGKRLAEAGSTRSASPRVPRPGSPVFHPPTGRDRARFLSFRELRALACSRASRWPINS